MKIIFAGTPTFALAPLVALCQSAHDVVAVYTQPDKPAGRGRKLTASPVKAYAQSQGIPVFQPASLRDTAVQAAMAELAADVMVVVAYGLILPGAVLSIPRHGCINIHASLLPRWRGAAPIQQAILAGDAKTGVSIMQMDAGLDTGAVYKEVACPILVTDTSQCLHDKLSTLGAEALLTVLAQLAQGQAVAKPQSDAGVTYAHKISKAAAEIDWRTTAEVIERAVRGYFPWPIAFSDLDGRQLRIWQAAVLDQSTAAPPGTITQVTTAGIDVATGNGTLRILKLQLPGKKCQTAADIANANYPWLQEGVRFAIVTD